MRTTIDLAADVRVEVERLRREQNLGLSEAVNLLVRVGASTANRSREPVSWSTYGMGSARVDLDNVWKAVEEIDGPAYEGC